MTKLQEIQKLAASLRDKLTSLKAGPASDLDAIAKERIVLREKLELLSEQETEERERLEAEGAAAKEKQRRAFLLSVAGKAEKAVVRHQKLTGRASELVTELVDVLVQRERVFVQEAVGLNTPVVFELL